MIRDISRIRVIRVIPSLRVTRVTGVTIEIRVIRMIRAHACEKDSLLIFFIFTFSASGPESGKWFGNFFPFPGPPAISFHSDPYLERGRHFFTLAGPAGRVLGGRRLPRTEDRG